MLGDKYQIFYSLDGHSVLHETADTWPRAKDVRNEVFHGNGKIRAAWIMRSNPSLDLPPRRYGNTMRRTRKEAQCTAS